MSTATLLDRLEAVRQTAPGRWIARCPAHPDRSPSLSVRELEDGRILLHDFGGCGAIDVLDSLGLEWSALFPERLPGRGESGAYPSSHSRIPARDLLEIVDLEMLIAVMLIEDILRTRAPSESDWHRLAQCSARIGRARDHAHGC